LFIPQDTFWIHIYSKSEILRMVPKGREESKRENSKSVGGKGDDLRGTMFHEVPGGHKA
jgi:hypothetical protein